MYCNEAIILTYMCIHEKQREKEEKKVREREDEGRAD